MDSRDRKRVSVLIVKDFLGAETGDCRMRRLLPAQAGDKPLASRSLRPRYIFLSTKMGLDSRCGRARLGRVALVTGCSAYPGSESGTDFRRNRSCRLLPAHQGVKTRSCDLVWRVGRVDSATPHSDPSGGQAPALHFLVPPSIIGPQFGTFRPRRARH